MELKIDVTISEDLSSSIGYNTIKSKVHIVLTEFYSMIPGSLVVIHSISLFISTNNREGEYVYCTSPSHEDA